MERMNHRACAEEEQRLEKGVRGEVVHRRRRTGHADCHDHVAQLRDRRVGEDAFDVVLLDRDERGEQCGEAADVGNDCQRISV